MSLYNNCYIDKSEHIHFISSSVKKNLIFIGFIIGVVVIISIIRNKRLTKKIKEYIINNYNYILLIIYLILIIEGIFIILFTQLHTKADSGSCFGAARNLLNGKNHDWIKGGYCSLYPNQNGLILFEMAVMKIFGEDNYLIFQFLNLAAILGSIISILSISKILWNDSKIKKILLLSSYILYYPFILYVTFIYGTVYGLFCMLLSILFLIKYLNNRKRGYAILSIILICLACFFKSNYLIALIAIILVLAYDTIFSKKMWSCLSIIILMLSFFGISKFTNMVIGNMINVPLEIGTPSIAWIEMGLQEGPMANGWYNGYNYVVMQANNCNNIEAKKVIKKDIEDTIKYFVNNKGYASSFFSKKIISQWREPTFESLWIQQDRMTSLEKNNRFLLDSFNNDSKLYNIYVSVFSYVQLAVYFGSILFIILMKDKNNINQAIGYIIVLGGFIFHTFWEAKSQYIIVYFILLIMYALQGYTLLYEEITSIIDKSNIRYLLKPKSERKDVKIIYKTLYKNKVFYIFVFILCIVAFITLLSINEYIILGDDIEQYYRAIQLNN